MNMGRMIVGADGVDKRSENDFYPTPAEATRAVMPLLATLIADGSHVLEPAAGNGAMSVVLEENYRVSKSDIVDRGCGADVVDFLKGPWPSKIDAVVTNPPFNLSEAFVRTTFDKTDARFLALILKSQWFHARKRVDLFLKHPPMYVCPMTWRVDFLGKGAPTMDTLWVVWQRDHDGNYPAYLPLTKDGPAWL